MEGASTPVACRGISFDETATLLALGNQVAKSFAAVWADMMVRCVMKGIDVCPYGGTDDTRRFGHLEL